MNKNVGSGEDQSMWQWYLDQRVADASNYHLTNTTDTTAANITQRDLTVASHGVNKTYDGTIGRDGDPDRQRPDG